MEKFRLKKEAIPFFDKQMCEKIEKMPFWDKNGVHPNALEPVQRVRVEYGHKRDNITHLSGYDGSTGVAHFEFRVEAETENKNYSKMCKPENIRELMDLFDKTVNEFFNTKGF